MLEKDREIALGLLKIVVRHTGPENVLHGENDDDNSSKKFCNLVFPLSSLMIFIAMLVQIFLFN